MMRRLTLSVPTAALLVSLLATGSFAALPNRPYAPYIGYVFPAGGRTGAVFHVDVGGQNLRGVRGAIVSGEGVKATLVRWVPPPRPLEAPQARLLRRTLAYLAGLRRAEAAGYHAKASDAELSTKDPDTGAELPDHPLLKDLDKKSLDELDQIAAYFFHPRIPLQTKRAIAETITLEITIDPRATPGARDLRLEGGNGLTNPMPFHVGLLPEGREPTTYLKGIDRTYDLPMVWNGRIRAKEVDRYHFRARAGRDLVARVQARALVPYMADAVPGWMQAVVSVHDLDGKEIAYADDYRSDPDPVLHFRVPEDGEYVFEIRDAIYRGREDFVYRITIGELPFVTAIFPLGGQQGHLVKADLSGWNLPFDQAPLDTGEGPLGIRHATWQQGERVLDEVRYEVGDLPEVIESEPNDSIEKANAVEMPVVANGRIGKPGDVDVYRFRGKTGDVVVAEVHARSLGSPLDSLLRLLDADGKVLAWNDDHPDPSLGLLTDQADSMVRARLDHGGTYAVRISDALHHGSDAHAYRLRISLARPDFTLIVTPSSIDVPAGRNTVIEVHAVRRDGFDFPIDVSLADAPEGFSLDAARIPAGRSAVRITLNAPSRRFVEPLRLRVQGRAVVDGQEIVHDGVPADDWMQAFIWHSLVQVQDLLVTVRGGGRTTSRVEVLEDRPVTLRRGGKATVHFQGPSGLPLDTLHFELVDAPEGVSVSGARPTKNGFTLQLEAERSVEASGRQDNAIVEVFADVPDKGPTKKKGKKAAARRRVPVGILPAFPFEILR